MKNFKKVLALVLAVATLLSFATIASASVADFNDSKDVKHTEAVGILSTIGVLNGYKDGSYKPGRVITRAEAAKIIAMFDNGDTNIKELYAPVDFTDVASNHWAQSYISYCYHTGIIAGVGNKKYAPEAEVTGVQFLKMVLVVLGFDAKEEGLVGTGYSVRARNLAREVGLLEGIGNDFDYTKGLSRDNAAQMVWNAMNAYEVEYKTSLIAGPDGKLSTQITVQDKMSSEKQRITLLEDKYEAKKVDAGQLLTCSKVDGKDYYSITTKDSAGKTTTYNKIYADVSDFIGQNIKVLRKVDATSNEVTIYGVYADEDSKVIASSSVGTLDTVKTS